MRMRCVAFFLLQIILQFRNQRIPFLPTVGFGQRFLYPPSFGAYWMLSVNREVLNGLFGAMQQADFLYLG